MEDEYLERETTKKGTKKGAGKPIMYGVDKDEQLLTWLLDARGSQTTTSHNATPQSESFRADYPYIPTVSSVQSLRMAECKILARHIQQISVACTCTYMLNLSSADCKTRQARLSSLRHAHLSVPPVKAGRFFSRSLQQRSQSSHLCLCPSKKLGSA